MTRRARRAACLIATIAVLAAAGSAFAHPRGQRPVIVLVRTGVGVDVSWVVAADDMQAIGRSLALGPITTEAYAEHPAYVGYVLEGLTFTPPGGAPCASELVSVDEVATGYATTISADCGGPVERIRMHTDLLFEISREYVHLYEAATTTTVLRGALSVDARDADLDLASTTPPSADPEEDLGARSRLETFARGEGSLSLFVAIGIALVLGAVHGLTPGHGKTLTAAYVAGAHGTLRQAGLLSAVVALAHGVSTFVLAMLASSVDKLAPQRITPWLEGASAILAAIVGIALLRGRHRHHHHAAEPRSETRIGQLIAIGLIGGLIPGPEAFAVGFTAVAVGELTRAIIVIAAFSIGLAVVVFAVAAIAVAAGHRIGSTERAEHLARRIGGIVFLGVAGWLAVRAVTAG